ncbi:ABC transporter ATP-binding protein [Verrucomicrobiaceae bacterium R5-34]|uniref:ABC transporter ATP-binding protein n=1 Tax=Oceaniferula flava TaxID=2800421 RepID=A0AAE2V9T0_9BACT|nr:ABC transporter ATP-binding protein [Oceaniferula flavus]MBK1831157.1 ABC transporter ATP-binding protein [Verrucomicrobiaceae bacterium R5-34]MBK1855673.1 ABC transporter ATP-binding protein [Oceaniferula flavus]MBM1136979.1 ABC transporter ATP-binding protein [Oceaniferula flavus]
MSNCKHQHEDGQTHQLDVEGVCVSYRKNRVLEDISFSTRCGNCLALVGPNGAGKSTLLKAIAGLVKRSHGSIRWSGEDNMKCRGGEFAYLPQFEEVSWDFPITVRGVVEMGRYPQLGPWRKFGEQDSAAVNSALEMMEMDGELANRQINELSGGQKQRVFIARAVAQQAHVLLLDEPFTGLDRNHMANLARLLRMLAGENRLVIASHHDLNSAHEIFDEALLLNRTMIAQGPCASTLTEENLDRTFSKDN